jgi:hypothetical protein
MDPSARAATAATSSGSPPTSRSDPRTLARQLSFNKAKHQAQKVQRDKHVAQAEYEKKHREEGH